MTRFFLGLTGASGHAYARAIARGLLAAGHDIDLVVSAAGLKVLGHELGPGEALEADGPEVLLVGRALSARVRRFEIEQVEAPAASGSALTGGVVLAPCSVGTLGRIAYGLSSNLIERAADVALKERRKLVLVVRETPLSSLHLENMLRLSRAGAIVMPAAPGFYHLPRTLDDLTAQLAGKVLDVLGVQHALSKRWSGELAGEAELPAPRESGA